MTMTMISSYSVSLLLLLVYSVYVSATIKVQVNNAFITETTQGLNGRNLKDVKVTTLDFLPNPTVSSLHFIINFEQLLSLKIENNELTTIPVFENMKNVQQISLQRNNLTSVNNSNFVSVEPSKIYLGYNSINQIEDKSFNDKIRILELQCNNLNIVSSAWFDKPEYLEHLDVSNNKITTIRRHLFENFKLKYINLSSNHISRIEPSSFTKKEMVVLNLRYNFLSELNPNIFSNSNAHIHRLYLDYNKLNYLSVELMNKLYGFDIAQLNYVLRTAVGDWKAMSIDGNPWECKCLNKLERWLVQYKIARHVMNPANEDPKCVVSKQKPEICIDAVDPELYQVYSQSVTRQENVCSV